MSLLDTSLVENRNWRSVGEAYEITKKPRGLDMDSLTTIPFASMDSIPQGGEYKPNYTEKPTKQIRSGTYFERGDILVAKITPSWENGKQAFATELSTPFGFATTEVIPLRPRTDGQDSRFLFFYLLHPDIRSYVAERMEGTTGRQRIPKDVVLNLPFPEFNHKEQTEIANSLELIQRLMTIEKRLIKKTTDLKRAAMNTLFTRGLRGESQKETEIGLVPESWGVKSIRDQFHVLSGGTPSRRKPEYWNNGQIPWVKTTEIDYCVIQKTGEHVTQAGLDNSSAKLLPPGTLLMAMFGQGVTRGKVAMLGIEASCNQACAALIPKDGEINSRYLYHFLSFSYESIRQKAHGGHQQNLNLGIVGDLPVAVPESKDTQQEIVDILDTIDRKIDLHRRKRAVLEELFKALLHGLMTGEIGVGELDLLE